jgi:hypothetical protein
MEDAVAYVRSLSTTFEDCATRFGSVSRRWSETTTTTRSMWDDSAGRDLFLRFLDPHHDLVSQAYPSAAQALEHQQAALGSMGRAVDAAQRSASDVAQAAAAGQRARSHAAAARQDVASARADISRTRMMAQDVMTRVSTLGE